MNQSPRFFGFFCFILLSAHSLAQQDHPTLYSVPTPQPTLQLSTPDLTTVDHTLPTIPLPQPTTHIFDNWAAQQHPASTPVVPETPTVDNLQDLTPPTNPIMNPISPYQNYQSPVVPQAPQIEYLVIGVNKTISLLSQQSQRYSMVITESKKQSILFFVIGPFSNLSYQQTSIRLSLKNPNGAEEAVNNCEDIGVNVCLLPGSRLKTGDQVMVDIKCASDQTCMFDLETYWSNAYPLHLNKPLVMDFEVDAYAKLFRLDMTNKNFKEVRILLTTKTVLESDSPIHLYANFGNQPPSKQKHDFAGIHLWDDGLGIFIEKSKLNQTTLSVIVQGPASNVLEIQAKVITDYHHILKLNTIEYDYLNSNQARSYYIVLPTKKIDMSLKLSTFTGSVEITFYKDEKLTEIFMAGQFQTFGDRLYRLPATHLEGNNVNNRLYVKVHSGHVPSTFVLKLTGAIEKAIQLSTDISDMVELKQEEIANYYVNTYLQPSSKDPKVLKFTVHNIAGRNAPIFRLCHETQEANCHVDYATYVANKSNYDQIKPTSIVTSGSTAIYKITLEPNLFVLDSHSTKFKRAILSVVLAQQASGSYLFGIEYTDDSVMKTLREGTPLKDRITIGSKRLYKVAPLSKDVVTVHIHLVEISGNVGMFGALSDPRTQNFQGQNLDVPIKNQLVYEAKNLPHNHTIFVIVQGEENAMFSLAVTFKRVVQLSQSMEFKDKFNYISLAENVEQQFTIQPYTYEVVYLATNFLVHQFTYSSSFPLQLCARKDNLKFPKDPNCDVKIGSGKAQLPEAKSYYVGIGNPTNKTASVTVKYSNIYGCQQKNLGSPWKKYFQSTNTSKCVKYTIHKNQSLQIITSIDTYAYPSMHSVIYINDYKHQLNQPYLFLDASIFTQHCHSSYCVVGIMFENLTKTNVQVLAQYVDQEIGLLDGISQEVFTAASPSFYKKFKFWIPNKEQTTVIVESKEGHFEFFVNVRDEFEGHMNNQIYPTRNNSMFKSNNLYYTMYNTLTITAEQLKTVNCVSCVLYITVSGVEESYVQKARFIIEASQERKVLKSLALTPGYLSMNSFSYYQYQFKKENGSLVVSLSTENTNCANTYVQKGKNKATPEHHVARSYGDETIVAATKGPYSIAIEATKDCKYTISVSETKIKVSEIKQGVYKDLRLEKDQTAFLFYHHVIDTPFKVLSMQEYGQVMISVATMDRAAIESLENVTNFDDKILTQFEWPGSKDVLRVSTVDKGYCHNCYYLVLVKGLKKTWTSIMLYTSDIDIPLTTGDEITDILVSNQLMYYKMYTHSSKKVNISMFVHYGEVEFTVVGKPNNTRVFKKSNTTEYWEVEIHKEVRETYLPTHFTVFAKADTMYRLIIKSEEAKLFGNHKEMKFGYPTYMFLSSKQTSCAEATISEKDQKLLVSASRSDKNKFQNLTVVVKLGNTTVNNTKNEIIESTMVISLPNQNIYFPSQKTNITYCFTSDSYLSLTLIPTASVTFLPENSQILVKKQQNLTINARGKLFVEVFECEGNAHILLSKQFIKLKGGLSEIMHWRRFGANYLLELEQTGPLYMNVDGPKALVKWQHIDAVKGEGMGYYYFRAPQASYDKTGSSINFEIPPLIESQPIVKNTIIQGINYTLMISDSKKVLKSGVQCNIGSLHKEHQFSTGAEINRTIYINVPTSTLRQRFNDSSYIFASVVAQVTLITPSNNTQMYRFIYDDEQILFKEVSLTREDQHQKYGTWFWILWGATLVVIALYFLSRIAIAKYKARHIRLNQGSDMEINEVDSVR